MDYLLNDEITEKNGARTLGVTELFGDLCRTIRSQIHERKSSRQIFGMPLYHIGRDAHGFFAVGLKARGVFAVGLRARGIVSLGLLSFGVLAFGLLSLGIIALGVFAAGLLSVGSIALGLFAAGAVSVGIISFGALSLGCFSSGALAVGRYAAVGDHAYAMLAVGESNAAGSLYRFIGTKSDADIMHMIDLMNDSVPSVLRWAEKIYGFYLMH